MHCSTKAFLIGITTLLITTRHLSSSSSSSSLFHSTTTNHHHHHHTHKTPITVTNPSFEDGSTGWSGTASISSSSAHAPPSGTHFASLSSGEYLQQSDIVLPPPITHDNDEEEEEEEEMEYVVRVMGRSINPLGINPPSLLRISLTLHLPNTPTPSTTTTTTTITTQLNPPPLHPTTTTIPNDDGGNVFFDGPYRLQISEHILYQTPKSSLHPITDPWEIADVELPEPANYAPAPIHIPSTGLRAVYATAGAGGRAVSDECTEVCDLCEAEGNCYGLAQDGDLGGCVCEATIVPIHLRGTPPEYSFDTTSTPVLSHSAIKLNNTYTPFFPSPGDAHLFYDPPPSHRLWMTWGGWTLYITELDPNTGRLLGNPPSTEVDDCIQSNPSCATPVLSFADSLLVGGRGDIPEGWSGDEHSSIPYVEGPALYKRDGWWYVFGTYGDMDLDYTIRMCRKNDALAPNEGVFVDKDGLDCTLFDGGVGRYGCSVLLAGEGGQLVPGHPHLWEEEEEEGGERTTYMGYDYRTALDETDVLGIRTLEWIDGWPTVWNTVELVLRTGDLRRLLSGGKATLTLMLESVGEGVVGVDRVVMESRKSTAEPPPPDDDDDDDDGLVCVDDEKFRIRMGTSGRKRSCRKLKRKHCDRWDGRTGKLVMNYCVELCDFCGVERCRNDPKFKFIDPDTNQKIKCRKLTKDRCYEKDAKNRKMREWCRRKCKFCDR